MPNWVLGLVVLVWLSLICLLAIVTTKAIKQYGCGVAELAFTIKSPCTNEECPCACHQVHVEVREL